MEAKHWKRTRLGGADICDALRGLSTERLDVCRWFSEKWMSCDVYVGWAEAGLQTGTEEERVNVFSHAKRAASRRIDELLLGHQLWKIARASYGAKVEVLREIGLAVPDVVNDLVLTPRNMIEHAYAQPDIADARHAVGTAKLFVQATEPLTEYCSVVMVNGGVLYHGATESVEVTGIQDDPFVFFDILDDEKHVKVVHPQSEEILWADLANVEKADALAIGRWLRTACASSTCRSGFSTEVISAIKAQCGL